MIALPLHVYSSLIASQNEEFKRYETFQTPAASRRTISRAARSCSSAERVPNFFGGGRRLGASLLIKPIHPSLLNKTPVTQQLASGDSNNGPKIGPVAGASTRERFP